MALGIPTLRAENTNNATGTNSLVATMGATGISSGSLIIVCVGYGAATTSTVSVADSAGNTYTQDKTAAFNANAFSHIFSAPATGALAATTGTVTVTFSTVAANFPDVQVLELTGADITGSRLDGSGTQSTGTSASPSSTSITTANANDCIISAQEINTNPTYTKAGTYTLIKYTSVGTSKSLATQYREPGATGTYSDTSSLSGSFSWACCQVAYKASTGGSPPANTVAPAVTGTTTVGSVLTTTNGTWTDNGSPTFTYQWQRDVAGNLSFSNIGSATSSTYTLVAADDGNKVRCVVTDTDANGATAANSNAVGLILEPGVPVNTVAPVVSGTTTVGQVLSSTAGTFTLFDGSVHTTAYQWQRDAFGNSSYSNISSATASTYTLVDADDACNIRCVVTATNDVGSSSGTNSNAVGTVIEPAPSNSVVGTLGGTNANVGATITTTDGTWSNMGGHLPTFTYQWRDSATAGGTYADITGATSSGYTVEVGELNKFLKVVVTAHNTNGSSASTTSVASNQVGAAVAGGTAINMLLLGAG